MARFLLLILLLAVCVNVVAANIFNRVVLKHREASAIEAVIAPLLPENSGISADGNTVIISAPANTANSLIAVIKRMDKPRKQLHVSVFRGQHPEKKGAIISTTHVKANHKQDVTIYDGHPLAITERSVVNVPVTNIHYADDISSGARLQANVFDSGLASADESSLATLLSQLESRVIQRVDQSRSLSAGSVLSGQQQQWLESPTGIYLRITLVGKKQARVAARVISPGEVSGGSVGDSQRLTLAYELETTSTIPLGQWSRLGRQQTFTHQLELDKRSHVYSTQTSKDKHSSVWIKVDVQ